MTSWVDFDTSVIIALERPGAKDQLKLLTIYIPSNRFYKLLDKSV
jgi:hypothetical protein